jgi:signal transduction histidine kinase
MGWRHDLLFSQTQGNSLKDVKSRLVFIFSVIALSSSSLLFTCFSLYLVFSENTRLEQHLMSFKTIAQQYYPLVENNIHHPTPYISAYYDEKALPRHIAKELPFTKEKVSYINRYSDHGLLVFHSSFQLHSGKEIPLYLVISNRALELGDGNWDSMLSLSLVLMIFLIYFLRRSLQTVFDDLMSPISTLTDQLVDGRDSNFSVAEHSVDEIQRLTMHLNRYKQIKERLAKQEMMFAKYASHELKTPISVVLGAASLQSMKQDRDFQIKQQQRIIQAAESMHATVEVLLNIVKQENAIDASNIRKLNDSDVCVNKYKDTLSDDVSLVVFVKPNCQTNLPKAVLNMVLDNLINNAIRVTTQGSITVTLEDDFITVIDSGCGLTASTETEHGLGLLIVRRLCQSYHWSFSLTNNQGKGCCAKLVRLQ